MEKTEKTDVTFICRCFDVSQVLYAVRVRPLPAQHRVHLRHALSKGRHGGDGAQTQKKKRCICELEHRAHVSEAEAHHK